MRLGANDGLDLGGLGLGAELLGAEHVAVVGHRDGVHAELGRAFGEVLQPIGPFRREACLRHFRVHLGVPHRQRPGRPGAREIGANWESWSHDCGTPLWRW
jgi:hypothetical protein